MIDAAAWKVTLTQDDTLLWQAPQGTPPAVVGHDPDTSLWLRFLAKLLAPLTPDEML